jgi:hypothetical protein
MKKSYHSNAVPADEAITTRAIGHTRRRRSPQPAMFDLPDREG